jgi:hypothetical protein
MVIALFESSVFSVCRFIFPVDLVFETTSTVLLVGPFLILKTTKTIVFSEFAAGISFVCVDELEIAQEAIISVKHNEARLYLISIWKKYSIEITFKCNAIFNTFGRQRTIIHCLMTFLKKINSKAKADINTGFGTNSSSYGGRFITKSGNANVKKTGIGFLDSISWYHTMLNIPRWKFLVIVVLFYFIVNFFFATLYYVNGVEHLKGVVITSNVDKFGQAFFFSIQTFTTVG